MVLRWKLNSNSNCMYIHWSLIRMGIGPKLFGLARVHCTLSCCMVSHFATFHFRVPQVQLVMLVVLETLEKGYVPPIMELV